jgi:hypothetical protein
MDAVVGSAPDRLVYFRWGPEFHIRHPHGETVFLRDPVPVFHAVPLFTVGTSPVNDGVEIMTHAVFLLQGS